MANLSTQLADALVTHSIDLLRLSAGLSRQLMPVLTQLESDIVKQLLRTHPSLSAAMRLQAVLREVRALIDQAYSGMASTFAERIGGVAQFEASAVASAVNGSIGVDLMSGTLPKQTLAALATKTLIQGAPSKDWWARQAQDLAFKFAVQVRTGMGLGETNEKIVARITGTRTTPGIMVAPRAAVRALVQTSVQTAANAARLEVFKRNDDVLKGVQQISTLDDRTCWSPDALVAMADGSRKPIGEVEYGDLVVGGVSGAPCRVTATARTTERSSIAVWLDGVYIGNTTYAHKILTPNGWEAAGSLCLSADVRDRQVLCRRIAGPEEAASAACEDSDNVEDQLALVQCDPETWRAFADNFGEDYLLSKGFHPGKEVHRATYDEDSARIQHYDGWRGCGGVAAGDICSGRAGAEAALARGRRVQGTRVRGSEARGAEGVGGQQALLRDRGGKGFFEAALGVGMVGEDHKTQSEAVFGGFEGEAQRLCTSGMVKLSRQIQRGAGGSPGQVARDRSGMGCYQESQDVGDDEAEMARLGVQGKDGAAAPTRTTVSGETQSSWLKDFGSVDTGTSCCAEHEDEDWTGTSGWLGKAWNLRSGEIYGVEQTEAVEIVSLSIEGDQSYVVGGIIVHNTDVCIAYDHQAWDLDGNPLPGSSLPFNGGPPRHWGCRSVLVPLTKSWEELGVKNVKEIKPGTRASMDGQVSAKLTYEDWLKGKSDAEQDAVLGKGKADLWRAGKISAQQLLDQGGRPLTLEQLQAKYGKVA